MTPSPASASSPVVVGIDVAKENLDLARSDAPRTRTFPNAPEGFAAILQHLQGTPVSVIVIESTGGLERPLIDALLRANLPVALVQPARVRHFALADGRLAKTDALDAHLLVRFGQKQDLRLLAKRPPVRELLGELTTARRQLVDTRATLAQQLDTTVAKRAREAIEKVLRTTDAQIKGLDAQIQSLIDNDDDLGAKAKILRSVPGVGPVVAAWLLARLCELGSLTGGQIAALVGVAPPANDSGARTGKRHIRGGRRDVRNVLYMATLTAMRVNPSIQCFAARLAGKPRPHKVVATACMRKLVVILNAMVRDGTMFNPSQAPVAA